VKIRGFRVQPGEIEAVLRRQEGVRECVVVARGEKEKRLVAYLAPVAAAQDAKRLRSALAAELPDYMVPSLFVGLDALPLTKNGKLDRRALPEPQAEEAHDAEAPATPVEELVAGSAAEAARRRPPDRP
jgi:acyl-CoA synthetase (AMP-forming)/AMP-acid ligase II